MPDSKVNRDYYINQKSLAIEAGELPYGKEKNPILAKMARKNPYYERNRAKICSFFVKGREMIFGCFGVDWWMVEIEEKLCDFDFEV